MQRISAIAGRIIRQFLADRRTMALLLLVPIFVMALIGYLISEDKEPVPVGLVEADRGAMTIFGPIDLGGGLAKILAEQKGIDLTKMATVEEAERAVRSGRILGAVVLPPDLSQAVQDGRRVSLRVLTKGTNQTTDRMVQVAAAQALSGFLARQAETGQLAAAVPRLTVTVHPLLAAGKPSGIDYFAPAFIMGFVFFFTFLLTSVSFLRERSSGTMERLAASPATRTEVMLGYLLGFLIFALMQSFLVLGYAVWALHVQIAGALSLVVLILIVLVIGVVNLGIALSFLARNELQVVQFIPVVLVPQVFLGGLIWPVETLHPALRGLACLFPLTHATSAVRDVMLGGAELGDIAGRLLFLAGFAVLTAMFGAVTLRKQFS